MEAGASDKKPLVAVAGASGFVGTHLRTQLAERFRFRALTRSANIVERNAGGSSTEWRHCDLYSLPKLTEALRGCDFAIYLVHSMAPSSRMMQGSFEDTDLLLADNFVRASEEAGVRHIVYLSGLMPAAGEKLSPHLRSRLEVESVLRSRSVAVTVLRAGLIFGPGGSSFSMLVNLVRRLPVMLLPAWVGSKTQSIDIENVCRAFELCLVETDWAGGIYDLGGHEAMTYRELIRRTAAILGSRTRTIDFPLNCFALSKHWVALFGGVAPALVGPLQESLCHDLEARPNALLARLDEELVPLEESLLRAVDERGRPRPNPRSHTQAHDRRRIQRERRVRSVQRMPLPAGWKAGDVAAEYGHWLSRTFGPFLRAGPEEGGVVRFRVSGVGWMLLELTPTPYTIANGRRRAFYISGGLLAREVDPPGRFEFRLFPENGCLIASIHGFSPRLPWWIYAGTQAIVHVLVMRSFSRHLGRKLRAD